MPESKQYAVVVRFNDGPDDVEHYGPFSNADVAGHYADLFTAWFATLTGDRKIERILITPLTPTIPTSDAGVDEEACAAIDERLTVMIAELKGIARKIESYTGCNHADAVDAIVTVIDAEMER